MPAERIWPVRGHAQAWAVDLLAASPQARVLATNWWQAIEQRGGLPHSHLHGCKAEHELGLDLPNCVKVRIPDPYEDDPNVSRWGAVLQLRAGDVLMFLAFGLRHPQLAGSRQDSVYQRAYRRLNPGRPMPGSRPR